MDALEFEDLADFLVGGSHEDPLVEFAKKYRIHPDKARILIADLLPLCTVATDKRSGQLCKGFATADGWIVKQPVIKPRVGA